VDSDELRRGCSAGAVLSASSSRPALPAIARR
jgi:hypothetical protein